MRTDFIDCMECAEGGGSNGGRSRADHPINLAVYIEPS